MPRQLPTSYGKKTPFRDARLFFIVCEGVKREVDYFSFFDRLSSRIKVITIHDPGGSAVSNAQATIQQAKRHHGCTSGDARWLVFDCDRLTDKEIALLHDIRRMGWRLALSNPCFEVWLSFHHQTPVGTPQSTACVEWKQFVHGLFQGGFDSGKHPRHLNVAVSSAKGSCSMEGFIPKLGSTSVHELGAEIYEYVKEILEDD